MLIKLTTREIGSNKTLQIKKLQRAFSLVAFRLWPADSYTRTCTLPHVHLYILLYAHTPPHICKDILIIMCSVVNKGTLKYQGEKCWTC